MAPLPTELLKNSLEKEIFAEKSAKKLSSLEGILPAACFYQSTR